MATPEEALATQLKNIQAKLDKTLEQLYAMLATSGASKVAEQRKWLMEATGLGYGDANAVVLMSRKAQEAPAPAAADDGDPLTAIYTGAKADLRPLHDALMARLSRLGAFEIAPKKGYVSLRRKKQFAMIGPATRTSIEIGLNAKALPAHARLKSMPAGSMCQATTRIDSADAIDADLLGWLKQAFDES